MSIEVLYRNRFQVIDNAKAESLTSNAWTVKIPVKDPIHGRVRREPTPEAWDGAIFLIDGVETEPSLGSGLVHGHVLISAFVI